MKKKNIKTNIAIILTVYYWYSNFSTISLPSLYVVTDERTLDKISSLFLYTRRIYNPDKISTKKEIVDKDKRSFL